MLQHFVLFDLLSNKYLKLDKYNVLNHADSESDASIFQNRKDCIRTIRAGKFPNKSLAILSVTERGNFKNCSSSGKEWNVFLIVVSDKCLAENLDKSLFLTDVECFALRFKSLADAEKFADRNEAKKIIKGRASAVAEYDADHLDADIEERSEINAPYVKPYIDFARSGAWQEFNNEEK